jgi:hypothetical protein
LTSHGSSFTINYRWIWRAPGCPRGRLATGCVGPKSIAPAAIMAAIATAYKMGLPVSISAGRGGGPTQSHGVWAIIDGSRD